MHSSLNYSANVCAGTRIKSTFDFKNSPDITYNVSALGLWCIAEMTIGFFVLCLPALPKLIKSSPWMLKLFSSLRSLSRSPSTSERAKSGGRMGNNLWLRPKPRRAPDASLFTDRSQQGFVPLVDVNRASESQDLDNKPGGHASHVDATSLQSAQV